MDVPVKRPLSERMEHDRWIRMTQELNHKGVKQWTQQDADWVRIHGHGNIYNWNLSFPEISDMLSIRNRLYDNYELFLRIGEEYPYY